MPFERCISNEDKKGDYFMENIFSREELLIGKENVEKLKKSKVAVFGIGGVGSYVVEALARKGNR